MIDLSHGVPPLDVRAGALLLSDSLPYLRHEAVVLAVVDPSVGRDLDIAIRTGDGRILVGPDNGLLAPAWRAAEGVASAVSITSSEILLEPVSPSFHARDVFAPAAAHLATGASFDEPRRADRAANARRSPRFRAHSRARQDRVRGARPQSIRERAAQRPHFPPRSSRSRPGGAHLGRGPSGNAVVKRVSTYADLTEGEWGLMVDPRGWLSVIRGKPIQRRRRPRSRRRRPRLAQPRTRLSSACSSHASRWQRPASVGTQTRSTRREPAPAASAGAEAGARCRRSAGRPCRG